MGSPPSLRALCNLGVPFPSPEPPNIPKLKTPAGRDLTLYSRANEDLRVHQHTPPSRMDTFCFLLRHFPSSEHSSADRLRSTVHSFPGVNAKYHKCRDCKTLVSASLGKGQAQLLGPCCAPSPYAPWLLRYVIHVDIKSDKPLLDAISNYVEDLPNVYEVS